jgi:hypothetical protein
MARPDPPMRQSCRQRGLEALLDAMDAFNDRDAPGRKWFASERWPDAHVQSSMNMEVSIPSRRRVPLGNGAWRATRIEGS